MPNAAQDGMASPLMRAFMKIHTAVAVQTPQTLNAETLLGISRELASLSDQLTATYLS